MSLPGRCVPPALQVSTCVYEGVVAHTCGHEVLYGQVGNPVLHLIVDRHDEAAHFAVQGVGYREPGSVDVTVLGQVQKLYSISEEYSIPTFLCPNLYPVDSGVIFQDFLWWICKASVARISPVTEASVFPESCIFRYWISVQPYMRSCALSPDLNSTLPWRSTTRFPMTTHDSVQ